MTQGGGVNQQHGRQDWSRPVVLLTDFGYQDHYAGVMRGVIAKLAPRAQIIDLSHGVPPQQVRLGALMLAQSWHHFPGDSVFVAVVDPGVGSSRLPLAISTRAGAYFIGPDNGLLWPAASAAGIAQAVELRNPDYRRPAVSATFHGRDIFAPAGAALANGLEMRLLGPPVSRIVELDLAGAVRQSGGALHGEVIYIDGFGNLITNLGVERVSQFIGARDRSTVRIKLKNHPAVELGGSYADAPVGAALALAGSFDLIEIAVRDGNARARYGAAPGDSVAIELVQE